MVTYTELKHYIDAFDEITVFDAGKPIYDEFREAWARWGIYDSDDYRRLRDYGIGIDRDDFIASNVETLDLRATALIINWIAGPNSNPFMPLALSTAAEAGFLSRLLRRIAELEGMWTRPEFVGFYDSRLDYGYLSNWYPSNFTYQGKRFATSEHFMMWEKARVFGDTAREKKILEADTPKKAKELGRKVVGFDSDVWKDVCRPLMVCGLRQKFLQNPRLMHNLLSTGSALLAEASSVDRIWGIGIGSWDPAAYNPDLWDGTNYLGRVLMKVRSDLRLLFKRCTCDRVDANERDKEPPEIDTLDDYADYIIRLKNPIWEWSTDELLDSQVGRMSLAQLSCVPTAKGIVRAYVRIAEHRMPGTVPLNTPLAEIDYDPDVVIGWGELLDELAFRRHVGLL